MEHLEPQALARAEQSATIDVDIPVDGALSESMAAALAVIHRSNEIRDRQQKDRLIPNRLTINLQVPAITSSERQLLIKAQVATRFRDGPQFQSAEEVRLFFRQDIADALLGATSQSVSQEDREQMANLVIKSRVHCQF